MNATVVERDVRRAVKHGVTPEMRQSLKAFTAFIKAELRGLRRLDARGVSQSERDLWLGRVGERSARHGMRVPKRLR